MPETVDRKIVVIPNDGIGPEITSATLPVLERLNDLHRLRLDLVVREGGMAALERTGGTIPPELRRECAAAAGVVLGPVSSYEYPKDNPDAVNPSMWFRKEFDLYANIRPSRVRKSVKAHVTDMDLVICRENTEGFYPDRNMAQGVGEFMPTDDVALSVRKITRRGSERIARVAFDMASVRRKKVTVAHKANVLKLTDGLFHAAALDVARDYPDVEVEELIIDAAVAHLVRRPQDFDVVLTSNMYGDILSDLTSELSGSLGLAGSINAGERHVMAQAQHGSAPDIAGRNIANPASLMLSCAMLLAELSRRTGRTNLAGAAAAFEQAIDEVLDDPENHTRDLGGEKTTAEFGEAVLKAVG